MDVSVMIGIKTVMIFAQQTIQNTDNNGMQDMERGRPAGVGFKSNYDLFKEQLHEAIVHSHITKNSCRSCLVKTSGFDIIAATSKDARLRTAAAGSCKNS